jgi:hypothetical protein
VAVVKAGAGVSARVGTGVVVAGVVVATEVTGVQVGLVSVVWRLSRRMTPTMCVPKTGIEADAA